MSPPVAITSTIRSPGSAALRSYVEYHRAIGFDRLYLFFDPDDPGATEAATMDGVHVVIVDDRYRAELRQHPYASRLAPLIFETGSSITSPDALTSLQLCNAAVALDLARRDGIRWLLHIDVDEAFHTGDISAPEHFGRLDAIGAGHARYINHEAMPEVPENDDYFRTMTLFKRNASEVGEDALLATRDLWEKHGGYFLAYANGKSAVRVVEGVHPATAHAFQLPRVPLGRCFLSAPAILHYPYTSFERFWQKHARLGDFTGDVLLGQRWEPPPFLLHARDLVLRGSKEEARRAYLRAVSIRDRRTRKKLEEMGMLVRIEGAASVLLSAGTRGEDHSPRVS